MQKCAFGNRCKGNVTCACKCSSPYLYYCDDHILKHMKTLGGDHLSECMVVELSRDQRKELLPKLKDLIKYLKRCRKNLLDNARILIEFIEKETWKAMNNIKELEKTSVDLISERSIYKENYERIKFITDVNHHYTSDDITNIKKMIESLCGTCNFEENWKECNQIIFSSDSAGGLLAIDLNTFKLSNLDYSPKIGQNCNACKIDQNTYFFHGGSYIAEAYLINIKSKNYETLKNGPKKDSGGSALKDNKVYIFGGHNGSRNPTNECEIFDLKTKVWKSITALPQVTSCITAAMLGKDIILSGYQLSCCYSYNDSAFTSILTLPAGVYKIVCEGWIYANSLLYENQDQIPSNWTIHNVISWENHLLTYCVFKKNQFLYFIDSRSYLMRINTKLKKLEKIDFS